MVAKGLHSGFFLNDGGFFELSVNPALQRIASPFRIDRAVPALPAGSYAWRTWQLRGRTDASRPISLIGTLIETNMFVDGLSQYDPVQKLRNTNLRDNLIHHPLSDADVLYDEQRVATRDNPRRAGASA